MLNTGRERRQHQRVAVNLTAHIATVDPERDGTGHPFFRLSDGSLCVNLSCGGAFLHSEHPIAPGTRVLIGLDLPGQGSFDAIGRVIRKKEMKCPSGEVYEGLAVEFIAGAEKELGFLAGMTAHESGMQDKNAVGF